MSVARKKVRATLSILILAVLLSSIAFTDLPAGDSPHGFYLVISDEGTALYRKDSPDGYPDFVQLAHLDQGAAVKLLHGPVVDPGTGQGVYGGDNPRFSTQTLHRVWNDFSLLQPNTLCITNGQFFSGHEGTARLPFPLKVDGQIVSDGYGLNQFPDQKLMLKIWPDRSDIVPLSEAALYASSAPHILAGLSEEASGNRPNMRTGRTFIGVGNPDQDGHYKTILIFNSKVARKTEAAGALRSFGAEKVMMLDGGGSAQLICQGDHYVVAGRKIPQTIAVIPALPVAETHNSHQPVSFLPCGLEATLVWPGYLHDVCIN